MMFLFKSISKWGNSLFGILIPRLAFQIPLLGTSEFPVDFSNSPVASLILPVRSSELLRWETCHARNVPGDRLRSAGGNLVGLHRQEDNFEVRTLRLEPGVKMDWMPFFRNGNPSGAENLIDRYTLIEASSDPIGSRLMTPGSASDPLLGEDYFIGAHHFMRSLGENICTKVFYIPSEDPDVGADCCGG